MLRPTLTVLILLPLVACGDDGQEPTTPDAVRRFAQEPIEIDFGMIPHGEVRVAEVEVPIPDAMAPLVPVGFNRNCVCASHRFLAEASDGTRREIGRDGTAMSADALRDGERVVLELTIDTGQKEAADLPSVPTAGTVVFQEVSRSARSHFVPLHYSFGIESPVAIRPAAVADLGDVPRDTRFTLPLRIQPDDPGLHFGDPTLRTTDGSTLARPGDLQATLRPLDDGASLLEISMTPTAGRPDGNFAALIEIPTDRADGWVLRIPVRGRVTPTIEISEPMMFSFGRIPLDQERLQSLVITDHAMDRDPEFHLVDIVDGGGESLAEHFEFRLTPVRTRPRARHAELRYLGTLEGVYGFRGEVLLAKEPGGEPVVRIPMSGFVRRD